jgi:hypothetical protein
VINKNDIYWVRQDVLGNSVSFYMKRWEDHASKHAHDKTPTNQEHFYQTIVDPDHARRSLDPVIGTETCIFEKFFEDEGERFLMPVIYDGVTAPGDYDQGGKSGKVLTGYFQYGPMSRNIGPIFWSKSELDSEEDSK